MSAMLDTVGEVLNELEMKYESDEEKGLVHLGVNGNDLSAHVFFRAEEDHNAMVLHILPHVMVPAEKRLTAAEFLTRANYGLRHGNFELDMNDGEVRYKVFASAEDSQFSNSMVKIMFLAGMSTVDRYYKGLMKVCFGEMEPQLAIDEIEKPRRAPLTLPDRISRRIGMQ